MTNCILRGFFVLCSLTRATFAVEIGGADSLNEVLQPALIAHLAKVGTEAKVRLDGTLPAREGLRDGKIDLALLFLRDGELLEKTSDGKAVRRFPLGAAAAYVYVHPSNRLPEIDLATLANIFGAGQRSDYKFWSDIPGVNTPEPILTFISVPNKHMGQTLFQGIALGGRAFKTSVRTQISSDLAQESISSRTNAILVSATPLPEKFGRQIKVADGREGRSTTPYTPDDTNIFNGDYPLRLPIVLCVPESQVAPNAEIIKWLLSDEVAGLIRKAGMVPAPSLIRERLVQRLDSK